MSSKSPTLVRMNAGEVGFRASKSDDSIGTMFGYAAVFNEITSIDTWEGKFDERIAPGAFAQTLKERGDKIKVLFNHGFDPSIGEKPLGKLSVLREDDHGLYMEAKLADTSYNRDLLPLLKSGALDGQSFRFSVIAEDHDKKRNLRTLTEIRLYEVGPVTWPAYEKTDAAARAQAIRSGLWTPPLSRAQARLKLLEMEAHL